MPFGKSSFLKCWYVTDRRSENLAKWFSSTYLRYPLVRGYRRSDNRRGGRPPRSGSRRCDSRARDCSGAARPEAYRRMHGPRSTEVSPEASPCGATPIRARGTEADPPEHGTPANRRFRAKRLDQGDALVLRNGKDAADPGEPDRFPGRDWQRPLRLSGSA